MDGRTWGISFRLASIFFAICLFTVGASASFSNEKEFYSGDQNSSPKISVTPLWEQYNPSSKPWTPFAWQLVKEYGLDMVAGSRDIETFCPNYYKQNRNDKITTWLFIVSTIVKYESYFDPLNRYEETGMGHDAITHRTIWSEGLLQLSYQDVLKYSFCDEFDWNHDRKLKGNDPRRTILDPYKNLRCGILILNDQIHEHEYLATREGAYWAVIMPSNKHNRLDKIKALVSGISICQKH